MGGTELNYINEAFKENWIAPLGPNVDNFELDLAKYTGAKYASALSSGTAAIHLALIMLGVTTDDEVICSSFTFSASCNPIVYQGAIPVFVDSEEITWNMDPDLLEKAIKDRIAKGKKPKAIILVHLYGMPSQMERIMAIADKYEIPSDFTPVNIAKVWPFVGTLPNLLARIQKGVVSVPTTALASVVVTRRRAEKSKNFVRIVVIAIAIGIIITTASDASTYVDFSTAQKMAEEGSNKKIHVVGKLPKDASGNIVDIHKNPVKSDVYKGDEMYHNSNSDCIIGIGGGAAIDVARAVLLRINHREDLFKYDDLIGGDKYVTNDVPHFITVPTTAGTGSEVGRSAIIADDETHQKKILFSPKLLAKIVFADPMLTMDLPAFVTAATDFLDTNYEQNLRALARKHDLVVIHLYDTRETNLPRLGIIPVYNLESQSVVWANTSSALFRSQ
ncbi:hypothetical protein B566_EDAN018888, partial [Ephemera danica]